MATAISQKQATDTVEKMYSDGELFMQRWNALINLQAHVKGTPLEKDYADLMSKGGKIRQTIDSVHFQVKKAYESIGQKVTDAWQWMKSKAGLEGMDGVEDVGMGVLPLLPIVAIGLTASAGAASAAMLNWSREADKFIGVYNDMVKRGVDPRTAGQVLNQNVTGPAQKGWLERLGLPSTESIGKLVLIGGGIYLFGKWRKWW
jgi:hypothetical protein